MNPKLIDALRSYKQADEEGVMVLVSRQACDEAATELESRCSYAEALRAALQGMLDATTSARWPLRAEQMLPMIEARNALAKNPNPSGRFSAEASGRLSPEASGPVGLGPLLEGIAMLLASVPTPSSERSASGWISQAVVNLQAMRDVLSQGTVSERDAGFAAGWAGACDYAVKSLRHHIDGDNLQHLHRLRWHVSDPDCQACSGGGAVRLPAPAGACIPVGSMERCHRCEERFLLSVPKAVLDQLPSEVKP